MKKKVPLSIVILFVLLATTLAVGCQQQPAPQPVPQPAPAPPSTLEPAPVPEPEPVPEPAPVQEPAPAPEEQTKDMQYAFNRLFELYNEDIREFVNKYNVITWENEETGEEFLVHKFGYRKGAGQWFMSSLMYAENVAKAKTHIENAHWLANEGKLPTDTQPRDITADEIIYEVNRALILLKRQEADSRYAAEEDLKWAREHTDPGINHELTFESIVSTHEAYQGALSKLITKLELILSKLPQSFPVS